MFSRDNQISSRAKDFKKTIDADQSRRKREETSTSIRKNLRDEAVTKRRQLQPQNLTSTASEIFIPDQYKLQFRQFEEGTIEMKLNNLGNLKNTLYSSEESLIYGSLVQFRKLLSTDSDPPIERVIKVDIIGKINELLQVKNTQVQMEAAWVVTNMASGSGNCDYLVDNGTVPILLSVCANPNVIEDVKDQCMWALSNISGENARYRDILIASGMMELAIDLAQQPNIKLSFLQTIVWSISNLCRGKPHPDFSRTSKCLPLLKHLLEKSDILEVLAEVCWTVSYLADDDTEDSSHTDIVVKSGVVPRIVELLTLEYKAVYTPALRAVGNILTGNKYATTACLDAEVLSALSNFLTINEGTYNYRPTIRRETCWSASNISAGSKKQIQQFLEDETLVKSLIHVARYDNADVQREAFYALTNAVNGTSESIKTLVENYKILKAFKEGLASTDIKIQKIILEALKTILRVGDSHIDKVYFNPYLEKMTNADIDLAVADLLTTSDIPTIVNLAEEVNNYFDSNDSNENIDVSNGQFAFTSSGKYHDI